MLPVDLIRRGQHVAWLADDVLAREEPRPGYPSTLYYGHPGIITDANPMHIISDWAGIEDTAFSWANGITVLPIGGPCLLLDALDEEEYLRRKDRIARGLRPLP